MSKIKANNTKAEIAVRSFLHQNGLRFRVNQKNITGKPDIVLKKFNTIVFVDGCFWHRHKGCKYSYTPKSKIEFWKNKFNNNMNRDIKVNDILKNEGWNVLRIWECHVKELSKLHGLIEKITMNRVFTF